MNKLIVLISFLVIFPSSMMSQGTFWIVKGGIGNELAPSLDTLPGGNVAMAYGTTSTSSGVHDIVFEVWPKTANSPSVEVMIGTSFAELLHNIKQYNGDLYLLGRGQLISSQTRPLMLKIDSTGSVLSSYLTHHSSHGGNYGYFSSAIFQEDTVYLGGMANGGNEDLIFSRYNLNTSSQISSNNWHVYQTERLRDLILGNRGRRIYGASYSYSGSLEIKPIFLIIDPATGAPANKYIYNVSGGGSFSQMMMAGNDSIDVLGWSSSGFLVRLDTLGVPGIGKRFNGSGGATISLTRMTAHEGKIYLCGTVNNESLGNGQNDGILICLDSAHNLLWAKVYGGSGDESITDLQISGNHIYLSGLTNTSGMGGNDIMLIKTDMNGNVAGTSACYAAIDLTGSVSITNFSITRSSLSSFTIESSNSGYTYAAVDQPATGIFNDACSVLKTKHTSQTESLEVERPVLDMFPNPFQNQLQFVVNEPGTLQFELYTLNGIKVTQGEKYLEAGEHWTVAMEEMAAGNYMMKYSITNPEIIHRGTRRLLKR